MLNDKLICNIINQFETPAYIYDLNIIDKKIDEIKNVITNVNNLYYSVKANPNIDILKHLKKHKLGVEVSSLGEIKLVQDLGYDMKDIIFSGPGKSENVLKYIIDLNIRCINVESIEEIKRIQKINDQKSIKTNIALRINPDKNTAKTGMKMTGISSQFGIDWCNIWEVIRFCLTCKNINLVGIQLYKGTQLLNANDILNNIKQAIYYVKEIKETFNIEYIDFGGGFGIDYFSNETPLDIEVLREGLKEIIRDNSTLFNEVYSIFESGRFLVADAGIYVTKIIEKKESQNNVFLICDGGSNHHANSAFLGRIARGNFPIKAITKKQRNIDENELVTITGPLCSPTDVIGKNISLKKCDADDLIVIEKSGAYGLTNSPLFFILHPLSKEIIIKNNEAIISQSMKQIFNLLIGE
ncbi:MAG: diaminopimelate decarboxylase [Oscillospiraceae bacterium]